MSVFLKTLFTSVCIIAMFVIDPLGIRVSAEKHYEDHILRLLSPFFSEKVSNKVTVILIDEAFLEKTERFPVNYTNLSRLLKVTGYHQPNAVFFDILQHHKHSDRFERWLKTLDKTNFPVFMASDPEYDSPTRLKNPDSIRSQLNAVSTFVSVSWSGEKHYYPLSVTAYEQDIPSAALALYRVYCEKMALKCQKNQTNSSYENSMVIQWTNKFDSHQNKFRYVGEACNALPKSNIGSMFETLWTLLVQGLIPEEKLDDKLRNKCPPVLTISAHSLIQPGASKSPILKEAIQGRLVLFGYHLSGGTDTVISPVHGKLPGVYNHAMALENLLEKGENYWNVPASTGFFNLSIADIFEIAIQISVLFTVIWYRYSHLETNDASQESLLSGLKPVIFVSLLILLTILFSDQLLDIGVSNWYALPLILILDIPIFFYFMLESLKKRMQVINKVAVRKSKVRFLLVKRRVKRKQNVIFKEAK
ncbi:CHASE2 domain-containing protein [Enterovibrio sp. ZSDZ35]|uniref:CHASE2 domain-containing protein n=1 Tax=Enterovibrio qingdaonensis TaxID=2899818 RepID=A0ABT5QJG1_9GAMM|nr:CHASE2 domain-containing protein [Enterovibrio sp. ZSDZ35]MDD1781119.1 CHASE2 domain-containing protein [Enterovibrio sp. ZSDZ35]